MRVGLAMLLVIAGVAEAEACSCRPASRAETVARADLVASGTVTAFEPAERTRRVTIRVAQVEKGPRLAQVQVYTPSSAAACGVTFRVGEQVTVAATRRGQFYLTNTCLQFGLRR